ncbi:hypothetical protein D3C83_65990 [compost metagenome]
MDLAHFIKALVNVGDLDGEHETHRSLAGFGQLARERLGIFLLKLEKPLFRRLELFFEFFEPARMRKITGPGNVDAFELGPIFKMFKIKVFAGGAGIMGM